MTVKKNFPVGVLLISIPKSIGKFVGKIGDLEKKVKALEAALKNTKHELKI
ncbi:hypothetical protein [Bacillus thuringiensis]|uniref:hypothetical protein n=1 Tax=Bacillus thuringiensis TaxID=1428 RepID=UPI00211D32D4|nr:hypothetical protein [Bacillus thuringiensis]